MVTSAEIQTLADRFRQELSQRATANARESSACPKVEMMSVVNNSTDQLNSVAAAMQEHRHQCSKCSHTLQNERSDPHELGRKRRAR